MHAKMLCFESQASVNGAPKHPLATPWSENRRYLSGRSLTKGGKWNMGVASFQVGEDIDFLNVLIYMYKLQGWNPSWFKYGKQNSSS